MFRLLCYTHLIFQYKAGSNDMQTDLINLNEASTLQPPGVFRRNVTQKLDLVHNVYKDAKGMETDADCSRRPD